LCEIDRFRGQKEADDTPARRSCLEKHAKTSFNLDQQRFSCLMKSDAGNAIQLSNGSLQIDDIQPP
jgi:hypothetical protein